jgi:hypothetical protein
MADMSTPLTALCNICHSEPPKYTCPRDRVRTCSLACSQAHKRRAACTGLRDPSAYMSKSALSTAGGIDRDYNFLSSVERNMDRADKETSERGVSLSGQGKAGFHKRWHDNGALARYLREHGIEVHKAPIGMARQKANQTRFIQKSRRIVWSVEWVVDGEKRMAEVDESRTMEQAYQELVLEKERESKKRKRAPDGGAAKIQKQKIQPENADVMKHLQNKAVAEEVTSNAEVATQTKSEKSTELGVAEVAPSTDKVETIDPSSADRQAEPPENGPSSPKKTPHFYLHKPHTSSKNTVLIPITASTTLTNALSNTRTFSNFLHSTFLPLKFLQNQHLIPCLMATSPSTHTNTREMQKIKS